MTREHASHRRGIGNLVAPARFLAWALAFLSVSLLLKPMLGWRYGVMAGFDIASLLFFALCVPLLVHKAEHIRIAACRNDANRVVLLLITAAVMAVILAAVFSVMRHSDASQPRLVALVVTTLALAWLFSNWVYALHYAHLFYSEGEQGDCGGLEYPGTEEPDYSDFIYFAFGLGMTFQTSDVNITRREFRRVATLHCLAAFVFNLGVLAFTINALGG